MKACNNYAMKKAAIKAMLKAEGRKAGVTYVEQLAHDTALYPVADADNKDWGRTCWEKNGQVYILDFKDQH